VPAGWPDDGLPIGLQIVGRWRHVLLALTAIRHPSMITAAREQKSELMRRHTGLVGFISADGR
jgi:Asp-tRNA(Asn)/Glu-tRNA(Gln) amidotransferase A subunit family amidase